MGIKKEAKQAFKNIKKTLFKTREQKIFNEIGKMRKEVRKTNKQIKKLQIEEQKQMNDIRSLASQDNSNLGLLRLKAKRVIRTRMGINKMTIISAQITGMITDVKSMSSNNASFQSLRKVTKLMGKFGSGTSLKDFHKTINLFYKQDEMMNEKESVMNDIFVDLNPKENEEKDDLINQILVEAGLHIENELNIPDKKLDDVQLNSKVQSNVLDRLQRITKN